MKNIVGKYNKGLMFVAIAAGASAALALRSGSIDRRYCIGEKMDIKSQIIISLTSYKIISLLVGAAFAYMGYRLFSAGIWGHAGEVEGEFGDNKLVIKKAAPGTFFALFGAIIVSITLYKGLEFKDYTNDSSVESYVEIIEGDENDMPEKPPF
ncbi:hypothetical protein [Marinobacterium lacunae]|uniref:hypothetical protein n=1 Tax=Marinobacterium lacunae TaxID=1232683 RepID=UPI0018CC36D6|nr:hypothetical protein [Marinobacterium lacunae]